MKIAVFEDDLIVAEQLIRILKRNLQNAEFLPVAKSVAEGIQLLRQNKNIDIIFADIELTEGRLSFEIFQDIPIQSPIVFCTSYQKYALRAFELLAIDYILKPLQESDIIKTIKKFEQLRLLDGFVRNESIQAEVGWEDPVNFIVKVGPRVIIVHKNEIALISYEHGNTFIYTFSQNKYYTSTSLVEMERLLGDDFFRATKQHIICKRSILEIRLIQFRKLLVVLNIEFKGKIVISKLKKKALLQWLNGVKKI